MADSFCVAYIHYTPLLLEKDSFILAQANEHVKNIVHSLELPVVDIFLESGILTAKALKIITESVEKYDNIVICHSNALFLDKALTRQIIAAQTHSIADFTFYEYFPEGLAPFAINYGTCKKISLWMSTDSTPYEHYKIPYFLKKDLNQYDTEILIAPEDFRFIKESFFLENKRNQALLERVKSYWISAFDLRNFLNEHGKWLTYYPSFVNISLTNQRNNLAIFHYREQSPSFFLRYETLKLFLDSLKDLNPHLTIQFTQQDGEPFLHPEIKNILTLMKDYSNFQFFLETSGAFLEPFVDLIKEIPHLSTIIFIGASTSELYQKVHGADDFTRVEKNIDKLLNQCPEKTYLQYIRMTVNESDIALFLDRWKFCEQQIIIAQYNDFAKKMDPLKVVDLSPLKRFPCFHLQRELFLDFEGLLRLCSQDIEKKFVAIPFINSQDIENMIHQGAEEYQNHLRGEYFSLCQECDIWYQFNL